MTAEQTASGDEYGENKPISIFENSAVNNGLQHEAPGNKLQCLWGLLPVLKCIVYS